MTTDRGADGVQAGGGGSRFDKKFMSLPSFGN